ncbi:MAG: hypothetical protein CMM74_13105, partial [Rhodospirillaceae bacterium]|nr:hypothetical protein [Rhodospirillaceae bacterium]
VAEKLKLFSISVHAGLAETGAVMASAALCGLKVKGKAAHAASPYQGIDPIVMRSEIVNALQIISSRVTNILETIVVTVTHFHAGDTDNIISDEAILRGTARSFAE